MEICSSVKTLENPFVDPFKETLVPAVVDEDAVEATPASGWAASSTEGVSDGLASLEDDE